MSQLKLNLLGRVRAVDQAEAHIKFRTNRVQALLFYLATEYALGSAQHRRAGLLDLFWPGLPEKSAAQNLRQTLYQLKQNLPDFEPQDLNIEPIPLLYTDRQTIGLNGAYPFEIDVIEFARLLKGGPNDWVQAIELYRGPFLADFSLTDTETFEEWANARRAYFQTEMLDTLNSLTQHHIDNRFYADAIRFARRQIEIDNLREQGYQQLMVALARNGRRSEALAAYEELSDILQSDMGLAPDVESKRIREAIYGDEAEVSARPLHKLRSYRLKEQIGAGAYGAVYRAIQANVERDVAVKIILPKYANDPDFIRLFESEAQLVASLEHPHIVPLYDFWREPDNAFLVMRYLRGGNLQQAILEQPSGWPLNKAADLIDQISAALQAAHQKGVIHRDIKPANILLDEAQNGYLSDFGIAMSAFNESGESVNSGPNDLVITPSRSLISSVSPEQVRNEPLTFASDLYSLGIVTFELLTGQHPFEAKTPAELVYRHAHEPLPALETLRADLPAMVDGVVRKMTAKDPAERYPSPLIFAAELRQAVGAETNAPVEVAAIPLIKTLDVDNPYKGLQAFGEADAPLFFGRETLVEALVEKICSDRFLAVVGPSGSGKSSLVRAGLLPALRQAEGASDWFMTDMVPGTHPFEELENALLRVAVNRPPTLLGMLQDGERGLLRALKQILPGPQQGTLLLVIDQFEELFTLVSDQKEQQAFIDVLLEGLNDPASRLRVVLTLRADFYDRPLMVEGLSKLMQTHTEIITPLNSEELSRAIERPANLAGVAVEPALITSMVADIKEQPGGLPLLQYALTELYEKREEGRLTLSSYQAIGGVLGALAQRAETLFAALDSGEKRLVREIFLRLVTLGEGAGDTRRRVLRTELRNLAGEEDRAISTILDRYGEARLLSYDRDPHTREGTVEVAHEALLREWPRLRAWLTETRDDVRLQRLLAQAAAEWETAGQDDSFLLQGSRLERYAAWAEQPPIALTPLELRFLQQSVETQQAQIRTEAERQRRELETAQQLVETERKRAAEQSRSAQRFRFLALGLAGILIVAIAAGWLARVRGQAAEANLLESERSRLALESLNALNRGEGGDLTALLAIRSLKLGYSAEADQALQLALSQGFAQQRYIGHEGDVQMLDFSPDGRFFASAANDATIRIWDAQTGEELQQLVGHNGAIYEVDFSPDGKYLVSSGEDEVTIVWNLETGQEVMQRPGAPIGSGIDFSRDGSKLAISPNDRIDVYSFPDGNLLFSKDTYQDVNSTIVEFSDDDRFIATQPIIGSGHIRDSQTGEILTDLSGHTGWVGYITFSPDSSYALTTSQDGTARLWDVESGNEVRRFVGHSDAIFNGFFSPDGRQVVTGSYDRTARVWDVATGREIKRFAGHTDVVNVAFAPDGTRVLTGSGDQLIKLWDLNVELEPKALADFSLDHLQDQAAISISVDGSLVLVGRVTGRAELFDSETGQTLHEMIAGDYRINSVALSHDNRFTLTGSEDGSIQLWENATGERLWQRNEGRGEINSVLFAADDQHLLVATNQGSGLMFETNSSDLVAEFVQPSGPMLGIAISADNRWLATAGEDGIGRIWDSENGELMQELEGHIGSIHAIMFSPNGEQIATGGEDNVAKIWDRESGQLLNSFIGHTEAVLRVAFGPNGMYLITGSADQTARLWDLNLAEEAHQYVGHLSPLFHVGFSPDGEAVFTADSQAAFRWRPTLEDLIALACERLSRDFSEPEREFYGIVDQLPTCPNREGALAQVEPTWTPLATSAAPISGLELVTELEFIPMEVANVIQMGMPAQHIYLETGPDEVMRPTVLNADTLEQPIFSTAEFVPDTLVPPFELGPFTKGEPLGLTLGEWTAAEGHGTYTIRNNRAYLDLTFDHLISNGVYTLWCVTIQVEPFQILEEIPCGALDGSENDVFVDQNGQATFQLEMDPLPISTDEIIYEIALGYHSDGMTYGTLPGEYSKNLHIQLIYDFFPPGQ